ncbi:MAG: DNA helicase, partial [bacterium]|nr:DNA helicase [bacterium]
MDIASAQSVKIHSEIIDKLNYACHQSAFPFLRSLRVKSLESEQTFENITVTLSANPAFLKPKSWRLDRLAPGGEIVIPDRDVELNGEFLLAMAESTRGQVSIKAEIADCVLGELTKPVDLLAFNEWGGARAMPDLLAAFSMPNDPAVDRVLRDASLVLRNAGKPDSIDGYKSKSRQRVWEIVSAIYTAIANLGISYAVPPASFEQNGQK